MPIIQILMLNLLLTLPMLAFAQETVPQANGDCPTGYWPSGDFCKPIDPGNTSGADVIEKRGGRCPAGYDNSGKGHCKQSLNSDIRAIPKSANDCPTGYMRSGDYCKPFTASRPNDEYIIEKVGKQCPRAYISDNGYCKKLPNITYDAIPRKAGAKCPYAWRADGDYCVNR